MLRKSWIAMVVATAAVFGAGCGSANDADIAVGVNRLDQAQVMSFSAGPTNPVLDEGQNLGVRINRMCLSDNVSPATITVDWGDGAPLVIFPIAAMVMEPIVTVAGDDGLVCQQGEWIACDDTLPPTYPGDDNPLCNPSTNPLLLHPYADGGNLFAASLTADHPGGGPRVQGINVTVNNLPPIILDINRVGNTGEGRQHTYTVEVEDPGLLASEIEQVIWQWTPAATTEDPTTITCDCLITPNCDDGFDTTICGETDGPVTDQRLVRYLDGQATYRFDFTVVDKEGATTTAFETVSVSNSTPDVNSILLGSVSMSNNPASPSTVVEGQTYTLTGGVSDQGADTLTISWNFGDTTTYGGTAEITKESWPDLTNFDPLDVLTPAKAWNDDNDAVPNDLIDYSVVLGAVDDDLGVAPSLTRYVRVQDVNPVVSLSASSNSVNEGDTVTFVVTATSGADDPTFDPINPAGYKWTLHQTNNPVAIHLETETPPTNTVIVAPGTCQEDSTTCTLTFVDDPSLTTGLSSWDLWVTAADEDSETQVATPQRVAVANVLPRNILATLVPTTINEAQSAALTVSFEDPAQEFDGEYTLTIDWGDATTPVIVALAAPGTFAVQNHVYPDNKVCGSDGICTVTTRVCEVGGTLCTNGPSNNITVNNVAPTPTIEAPLAQANLVEGVNFALDGSYSDPAAALDQLYSYAWTWTDGAIPRQQSGTSAYATGATDVDHATGNLFTEVPAAGLSNVPITFRVTDSDLGIGTATVNVNVRDNTPSLVIDGYNCPPLPAPAAARETVVCALTVTVHGETDADLLRTIDINWGDGTIQTGLNVVNGIGAEAETLVLTKPGVYDDGREQPYDVTVTLRDEDSAVTANTQIVIDNVAPSFVEIVTSPAGDPVLVSEGESVNFSVTASDPSTTDVVAGLQIVFDWGDGDTDSGTMQRRGTTNEARFGAVHVYNNPRIYTVTITVTDKDGGTVSQTRSVEVLNRAPAITDVFDTGPVPEATEVTVVTLVDNPGRDMLHFTYNFNCLAVALGEVGSDDFTALPPQPWSLAEQSAVGTHTYNQNNTYNVCVRVCDNDGAANSCVYGWTPVVVTNVAPRISTFTATPNTLDEAPTPGAQVALVATATDVGPSDVLTYTFYCTDEGAASTPNTTGLATCYYPKSGVYTARVTVSDGNSGSDTRTTVVRVRNLAPVIASVTANPASVAQGTATVITAAATDPAGDAMVYSFDFNNDGVYDATTTVNNTSYAFSTIGNKTVRVRVCDDEGACSSATNAVAIAVTNAAPTIVRVDAPSQVTAGSEVGVTIWATDPGNDTLTYGWDFDGVAGYEISSSRNVTYYTFENAGAYRINVQVSDGNGGTDTEFVDVTVTDINVLIGVQVNPQPVNEGSPVTVTVTPQGTAPYLVSFDWNGNGSFSTAEGDDVDVRLTGSTLARQHTYRDDGSIRVSIRVIDNDGSGVMAQTATTIRVDNVAPTVTCPPAQSTATENAAYAATVGATDPGADDVLTYTLLTAPAGMALNGTNGAITWLPNYMARQQNPVAVEVTDGDGGSATCNWLISVSYVDADEDGISDAWADHYFDTSDIDPTADPDGDGLTNLQEFQAGTDPTVSNAPTAPVALAPVEQYVETFQPTLVFSNASDPDGDTLTYTCEVYQGEISGTADHVFADVAEGEGTTSIEMGENLIDGQKYWWRCRASDGVADGQWSDATWFVVAVANHAPAQLILLMPVDDGIVDTLRPALEARPVRDVDGDVVTYDFELYRNASLSGTPTHSAAGLADPYWTPASNLVEDASYWWRARAVDDKGAQGEWSVTFSFTVDATANANRLPPAPVVLVPAVDGVVSALRPYLEVSSVVDPDGDAVTYEFRVFDNDALTGTPVAQITGRTLPTWFVDEDLTDGDEYWWVARANDGHGTGPDSDHGHFTVALPVTNRPPTEPGISAPAAGAVVTDTTPALVVTNATDPDGDTLTYFFEVAANLAFSGSSLQASAAVAQGTGTTSWTVPTALAEDAVYYWRCRAFDGEIAGEWVVASFRVDAANGAPTAPVPLTPADGSMLLDGPSRLVAQNALDPEGAALSYKFEIGSSKEMTEILGTGNNVAEGDAATAWSVTGVSFEQGQTYFWRVTASDGVNNTTSAVVSFSIYEPGAGDETPEGGCGCGCSAAQPNGDFAILLLGMAGLMLIRRRRNS